VSEPAVYDLAGGDRAVPTDEEMAAILAAVEVAWPRTAEVDAVAEPPNRWRFSGRWWSKPVPARRDRPS
jgi:hypothetical protein